METFSEMNQRCEQIDMGCSLSALNVTLILFFKDFIKCSSHFF